MFAVAAGVACGTYVIYQFGGTANEQAWNDPDRTIDLDSVSDSQLSADNADTAERGGADGKNSDRNIGGELI